MFLKSVFGGSKIQYNDPQKMNRAIVSHPDINSWLTMSCDSARK
jgi:hypothetical protein